MKIIERIKSLLVFDFCVAVKLKRDEAAALTDEFATLESQLKAQKLRSTLLHGANQRLADQINHAFSVVRAIPGSENQIDRISYSIAWVENIQQELNKYEKLLDDRSAVIKAIPQCPAHGDCMPYALNWIAESKSIRTEYENLISAIHRLTNENAELKGQLFSVCQKNRSTSQL